MKINYNAHWWMVERASKEFEMKCFYKLLYARTVHFEIHNICTKHIYGLNVRIYIQIYGASRFILLHNILYI